MPATTGRSTVVTSVTLAPRAAASSARAWPCLPDERLPMKRTGSIGSRVPPAVTSTRTPGEVGGGGRAEERLGGGLDDGGGLGQAAGADVAAGQAPDLGLDDVHAAARAARARLSCTAGCSHISVCMAGHTSTGARVASSVLVSRSSLMPAA